MGNHLDKKRLLAYLDGDLKKVESRQVWQHVNQCAACYQRLKHEQLLREDLQREFVGFGRPARCVQRHQIGSFNLLFGESGHIHVGDDC